MKPPASEDFVEGFKSGILAVSIGMMGMVIKLLLSSEKVGWWKAIRHTLAAGLVAFIVGQFLESVQISNGLKMALLGISGASACEILDFAIRWIKSRGKKLVGSKYKAKQSKRL